MNNDKEDLQRAAEDLKKRLSTGPKWPDEPKDKGAEKEKDAMQVLAFTMPHASGAAIASPWASAAKAVGSVAKKPPPLPAAAKALGGAITGGGAAHKIVTGSAELAHLEVAFHNELGKIAEDLTEKARAHIAKKKVEELSKQAGLLSRLGKGVSEGAGEHATELAGLGILGVPVAHELHKSIKNKDKGGAASSGAELAGLGVLAAPSIAHLMRR